MRRPEIDELVEIAGNSPPYQQVAQRAIHLLRQDDFNVNELAQVISTDQVYTSLILRWANSSFYAFRNPASTVKQAILYLGQQTLKGLILAASSMRYMSRPLSFYGFSKGDLWRRSVGVAAGTQRLAEKLGKSLQLNREEMQVLADEAYHAGLLCDIGLMPFDQILQEAAREDPTLLSIPVIEAEIKVFGFHHATMGAVICDRWQFPPSIQQAILFHHAPHSALKELPLRESILVKAAYLADLAIDHGMELDNRLSAYNKPDPDSLAALGFDLADLDDLYAQVKPVIDQSTDLLLGF